VRILDHSADLRVSLDARTMGDGQSLLEIVTFAYIACGFKWIVGLVMDQGAEVQSARLPGVLAARGGGGDRR
jgi:lactam utilization protein B